MTPCTNHNMKDNTFKLLSKACFQVLNLINKLITFCMQYIVYTGNQERTSPKNIKQCFFNTVESQAKYVLIAKCKKKLL